MPDLLRPAILSDLEVLLLEIRNRPIVSISDDHVHRYQPDANPDGSGLAGALILGRALAEHGEEQRGN